MKSPYRNPSAIELNKPSSDYYDEDSLADYMEGYDIDGNYYVTTKMDAATGVVYFFINFSDAKTASTYYQNYYGSSDNKVKLDLYLRKYAKEYYVMGNQSITLAHDLRAALAKYEKALELDPKLVDA